VKPILLLCCGLLQAQTVRVWLTTDDQATLMAPQANIAFTGAPSASTPTIFVDDRQRYQQITGFGASFTDSSAWLMNNKIVPASSLPSVMNSLFGRAGGIGISFVRNPMGASDLARSIYSYDDQQAGATDPNLASFSIAHDEADIIPLVQQAKRINPQLKIMANPWSPPGWMKTSGSMIGGSLLPAAYAPLANYFVRYIQAYASAGIHIDYISMQNEPLYLPTAYPGMSMPATDQLTFLRDALLPALSSAGLSTKVLVYDHNWDTPSYPQTVLTDPAVAASQQIGGVAWHWYAGTPGAMSLVHNQFPARPNFVTEASGGTWITDEVKTDFETITQSMRNWASSYIKWGLALDENRGPFIPGGCGTCTPLITVNQTTGAVSYNIDYYTLGHFSKFVLPGALRVYSSNAPGIISAAFSNPDGTLALVAYNDSSASQTFQVAARGRSFNYTLPALAGATFVWEQGRSSASPYTVAAQQQIQASSYNNMLGLETETCTDAGGGFDVGYASPGSWAAYSNVDFGAGVSTAAIRMASASGGGTVDLHLDSPTGPMIGATAIVNTGGWQTWTTVTTPLTGASGSHTLYVVYQGTVNLNWFQFK
jgi:glucosylceramidase